MEQRPQHPLLFTEAVFTAFKEQQKHPCDHSKS
jgi:hypothetical protein